MTARYPARTRQLTPRQDKVLRLAAAGLGCRQIARHLGISVTGVASHLNLIRTKLGADAGCRGVDLARLAGVPSGPTVERTAS